MLRISGYSYSSLADRSRLPLKLAMLLSPRVQYKTDCKAPRTKKSRPTSWDEILLCGARDQIRTGDPHVGNVMLYQLSYSCV